MLLMKCSVIIPTLNSAKTVSHAINSVLKQSSYNLIEEIIIVDNGSSDSTIQTVEDFNCKKIRVLTCGNRGASHARNHGVAHSSCDWVAFLDSDDSWKPDKIRNQFALISLTDARLVGSSTFNILKRSEYQFYPFDFLRGNFLVTSSILFYRPILNGKLPFMIHVSFGEDYIAWIILSMLSQRNFLGPLDVSYKLTLKPNYTLYKIAISSIVTFFSVLRLSNFSSRTKVYSAFIFLLGSLRALPSILVRMLDFFRAA